MYFPVYIFFFSIFPILSLFANNRDEIFYNDLFLVIIPAILLALFLFLILNFVFKNRIKAGISASLYTLLFFSYWHIYKFFQSIFPILLTIRQRYFFGAWLVLLLLIGWLLWKTKRNLETTERAFNIMGVVLIMMPLVSIAAYDLRLQFDLSGSQQLETFTEKVMPVAEKYKGLKPDIYYIVLDGYANNETLKKLYSYDNRQFLEYLSDAGFYVVEDSTSNYTITSLALVSMLNMQYVNQVIEKNSPKAVSKIFSKAVRDNEVIRILQLFGYSIFHFSSGYSYTDYNKYADINFRLGYLNQFYIHTLRMTMLGPFYEKYFSNNKRKAILYTFDKLSEMPEYTKPKFIFAHIMAPHPPYVFGPNGEEISSVYELEGDVWGYRELYAEQLFFINKKLKELIDKIIASDENAIIVMQSDHGTASLGEWDNPSNDFLNERMRNFSAYRLPGSTTPEEITKTPVNTFRMILKHYFGVDIEFLEPKNYYTSYDRDEMYDFVDVTNDIKIW